MAVESVLLDQWLYGLLSTDLPLTLALGALGTALGTPSGWEPRTAMYPDAAPEGTPYPFIVWAWTPQPDILAQGGVRIVVRPLLHCYVIAPAAFGALAPVADRLDALLARTTAARPLLLFQCLRQQEWRREQALAGLFYRQLGGSYALLAGS